MQQGLSLNYYLLFRNSQFYYFYLDKEELQEKVADFKDNDINHFYYTCNLDSNTNVLYSLIINRNNFLSKLNQLQNFEYMIALKKQEGHFSFFGVFKNFHLLYVSIFKTDDDYIIIGDLGLYSEA